MAIRSELARKMYEGFNRRDYDAGVEALSERCQIINVPFGESFTGKEGARDFMRRWAAAFSDARVEVKNLILSDDYAVVEFLGRGTHTGSLSTPVGTLEATGKQAEVPFCDVIHFEGNEIVSIRSYFDAATMLRQLGATIALPVEVPVPAPS